MNDVYVVQYVSKKPPIQVRYLWPIVRPFERTEAYEVREYLKDILSVDLSMSDPLEAAKYMQHKARAALSKVQS